MSSKLQTSTARENALQGRWEGSRGAPARRVPAPTPRSADPAHLPAARPAAPAVHPAPSAICCFASGRAGLASPAPDLCDLRRLTQYAVEYGPIYRISLLGTTIVVSPAAWAKQVVHVRAGPSPPHGCSWQACRRPEQARPCTPRHHGNAAAGKCVVRHRRAPRATRSDSPSRRPAWLQRLFILSQNSSQRRTAHAPAPLTCAPD